MRCLKRSIRPALERAGIVGKQIGWHNFRHPMATAAGRWARMCPVAFWAWAGSVSSASALASPKPHPEEVLESHPGSGGTSCVEAVAHVDVGVGKIDSRLTQDG